MFIDISKAHLYAPVDPGVEAYVDLPIECQKEGVCGRLNFWLYGMRPASRGWESEYTRRLADIGLVAGKASPCCFHGVKGEIGCVVHGDDFDIEGDIEDLRDVAASLSKHWIVKVRAVLGPDAADDKEVSILNRIVRWGSQELFYEADPRHVEKLLKEMDMVDCKPVTSSGVKAGGGPAMGNEPVMASPTQCLREEVCACRKWQSS